VPLNYFEDPTPVRDAEEHVLASRYIQRPAPKGSRLSRKYRREIDQLENTYKETLQSDFSGLATVVERSQGGAAVFVGSGGALAVAKLASDLHQSVAHQSSMAKTPLQLAAGGLRPDNSVFIFSAGARNPDTAMAVQASLRSGCATTVITRQDESRIPSAVARPSVQVIRVASPSDGFLATNSVIAMATATCLAYGQPLEQRLPWLEADGLHLDPLRSHVLILYGPQHGGVALDLEARLSETGLGWVQLADLRNFAHGRHVGLATRSAEASVVSIEAPSTRHWRRRHSNFSQKMHIDWYSRPISATHRARSTCS